MVKLPKNYFENLSVTKYREYLKLLPTIKRENTKLVMMLIFTFVSLSFLGIFAINPTLSTIIELQKQLQESQSVNQQLKTKINNLSNLQQQYTNLSGDLPFVYDAIPQNALIPTLIGQITTLAQKSTIQIVSLHTSPVVLVDTKIPPTFKSHTSFTFTVEATGSYDQLIQFISSLTHFSRIVTIESISLIKNSKTNNLLLSIEGREYYKK
jgi:Tfp pilus assembly protein PilO